MPTHSYTYVDGCIIFSKKQTVFRKMAGWISFHRSHKQVWTNWKELWVHFIISERYVAMFSPPQQSHPGPETLRQTGLFLWSEWFQRSKSFKDSISRMHWRTFLKFGTNSLTYGPPWPPFSSLTVFSMHASLKNNQ